MVEDVVETKDAEFFLKEFSFLGSYSFQVFNRTGEYVGK